MIPDKSALSTLSVAKRLAHDLDVYHKLDAEVIYASEASERLQRASLGQGNVVVLGGSDNTFGRALLHGDKTAFSFSEGKLSLNGRVIGGEEFAALFLHPHPENPSGLVLFMYADTQVSLERAARLFPIRTGVAVPDWIVVGNAADAIGSAGVLGAG